MRRQVALALLFSLAGCPGTKPPAPNPAPPPASPAKGAPAPQKAPASKETPAAPVGPTQASLEAAMEALKPLHSAMGPVQEGDWLERFPEPGQSFRKWLRSDPVMPRGKRRVLCVAPLGEFRKDDRKIVDLSAEWLSLFFAVPSRIEADISVADFPPRAFRRWPVLGKEQTQILSTHVLDKVLKPRVPADAAALIAFTAMDLWPGEGWNFVFGQASLRERVGVWSLHRFGDPTAGEEAFRLCLLRTIKVAAHETGHMFSIEHCTAYECCMNGSNSLPESDRHPLWLCPECLAKVCFASQVEPAARYRKVADFCRTHGLATEADFYERSIRALEAKP